MEMMMTEVEAYFDLSNALKAAVYELDWQDEVSDADEEGISRLSTGFSMHDQICQMFIDVNEPRREIHVFMYSPFPIPATRSVDAIRLANFVNGRIYLGRIAAVEGAAEPIQLKISLYAGEAAIVTEQIKHMIETATGVFDYYYPLFARVAFTKDKVEEIISDLLESESH
jgi:hypothetical protein